MAQNHPTNKTLFDEISSEVSPATSPLLDFLLTHVRLIAAAAVLCALAGIGYAVYNWQAEKQVAKAQEALGRILISRNNDEKLAKLQAALAEAPSGVKEAVQLAIAKTAMEAKDYPTAYAAWDAIAKDSKKALHVTAMVGKAEILSLQEKTKEALAVAESIPLPPDTPFATLVNGIIVDLAEKLGDFPKAIATCEKIAASTAAFNPEEANFWRQKAASLRGREKAAGS